MEEQIKTAPQTDVEVVDIQFRSGQKIYFFDPDGQRFADGDHIIIDTARGEEFGICVGGNHKIPPKNVVAPLRKVLRRATPQDEKTIQENRAKEKRAFEVCQQKIAEHGLDMQLVNAEVAFDGSKILFYFTADERVDFRELVKNLASVFRTRIELRQIGVRHETQMLGAVGSCGMVCCCRRFLRKFVPVTIKMAKEQNLFLNPSKISGICGRLLCCLSYEQENYDIFHSSCPRLGKRYQTNKGPMKVLRANMFRNSVALLTDTNEELELTLDEWQALDPRRPDAPPRPEGKPDAKPENKPSSPRPHDELMVVMADPDTIDEAFGDESDELVDDLGGLNDGEMETLEEGLRPKRKRKRKR